RAAYMYAGMADVGAMTHDHVYDAALDRIWSNIVDTPMHITGGLGAIHGIEGFGPEYDLPNKDAYNETCAAIANVFFNHRLFLHHRDAKFFDVAEVALLNNSLAGVNLDGDRFFYVNPLEADGIRLFNHGNAGRAPWFDCACCPSNIARLMPQVSGYMYAANGAEIYCLLYGSSRTKIALKAGPVGITQKSRYPFDGYVRIAIALDAPQTFAAKLRIPTWAQDRFVPGRLYSYIGDKTPEWTVCVNGKRVTPRFERGFAIVTREWQDGDVLELNLPMPVRYSVCDEKVEANVDRIAVTRGPLVYCAEEVDNGGLVQRFVLPDAPGPESASASAFLTGPLQGMVKLMVPVLEVAEEALRDASMTLVPYFAWNNRGNGSMNVWFPRETDLARITLADARFDSSRYGEIETSSCGDGDTVDALTDGHCPQNASDTTIQRWSSGDGDCTPTITLTFPQRQKVESLGVYWVNDDGKGIAVPAEWRMEYLQNGEWHAFDLYVTDFFGVDRDMYVVVHPAAELACEGLRLVITPAPGKRVGLLDLDLVVK
ncbi:MAG: glycoside hydrolase family 127 protein, partial [Planctomycetes bacterium]|nr:glycoside hydrolase family 127 protein [Planctomycetota bacterium]